MQLPDLKVNVGSWQWSESSPHPSWQILARAKVWSSPEARFLNLREQVMKAPVAVELVPGGTDSMQVFSVDRGDTEENSTVSAFLGRPVAGAPAVAPGNLAVWEPHCAVIHCTDDKAPKAAYAACIAGKPCLLWSSLPGPIAEFRDRVAEANPDVRWFDILVGMKLLKGNPFAQYAQSRRWLCVTGMGQQLKAGVCSPVTI